jgi:hypothetical protein
VPCLDSSFGTARTFLFAYPSRNLGRLLVARYRRLAQRGLRLPAQRQPGELPPFQRTGWLRDHAAWAVS